MKKLVLLILIPMMLGCEEPWDDDCDQNHEEYDQESDGSVTIRGDVKDSEIDTVDGDVTIDGDAENVDINTAAESKEE